MTYSQSDITKTGGIFYGWIVVIAAFIIMMISNGLRYSFGVFLTPMEEDFGLTRAFTSGIFSTYMIISSLAAIPVGWCLDRYGPRIIGISIGVFAGLGLFLTAQAYEPWHLHITYGLLFGIGTGINFYITMSVISRWFVQKRALALAIVGTGLGVGTLALSSLTAYLISSYGWRASYLILAPIALIIISGAYLFLKKDPGEINTFPNGKEVSGTKSAASGDHKNTGIIELTLKQALRTRDYWFIFLLWATVSGCVHLVMTQVVAGAIGKGIPPVQAATILGFLGFFSIPGRLLLGAASDRFAKRKILIVCALSMSAGMLVLTWSSTLLMFYVATAIFGFFFGGMTPAYTAVVPESFGVRHIGVIMGSLAISWGAGAAISPALGGYVFDTTGSYYMAYLTGAVAMVMAAIFSFYLRPPRKKEVPSLRNS